MSYQHNTRKKAIKEFNRCNTPIVIDGKQFGYKKIKNQWKLRPYYETVTYTSAS